MSIYTFIDASTGRITQLILPAGCEPCMVCNGRGFWEDDWGDERTCEDCEGDGYIFTGDDCGGITIVTDESSEDNELPNNFPDMYDRPLF